MEWQDIDAMWEADTAAEWERINDTDDRNETALDRIGKAIIAVNNGCDWLADAVAVLNDEAVSYRVQSFLDDFAKLARDLARFLDRYESGE